MEKGQWSIAQDEFRTLRIDLASDSIVHEVVYQLGRIAIETQQYGDAVSEFQNVVDAGIQRLAPNAQFGIAQAFFSQSKYEEAISAYERTIENYPKSVAAQDSYFYIGWAYQRMGKMRRQLYNWKKLYHYIHGMRMRQIRLFL